MPAYEMRRLKLQRQLPNTSPEVGVQSLRKRVIWITAFHPEAIAMAPRGQTKRSQFYSSSPSRLRQHYLKLRKEALVQQQVKIKEPYIRCSLLSLPNELLIPIILLIDNPYILLFLSSTCHRLHNIINDPRIQHRYRAQASHWFRSSIGGLLSHIIQQAQTDPDSYLWHDGINRAPDFGPEEYRPHQSRKGRGTRLWDNKGSEFERKSLNWRPSSYGMHTILPWSQERMKRFHEKVIWEAEKTKHGWIDPPGYGEVVLGWELLQIYNRWFRFNNGGPLSELQYIFLQLEQATETEHSAKMAARQRKTKGWHEVDAFFCHWQSSINPGRRRWRDPRGFAMMPYHNWGHGHWQS
ncbi:hypothetical protein BJ508DRAFT_304905 [Ascobolus immersus RN42]|uniref:F-box domain-containing protein n=1 Tax=Ascobolus immersus RN42 TaxID=1160509 RepID=A0A3N4ICH2_ASCIM|nr:hypothetical protein BJ508DRAFT_304905 [Ascobolus immersus RN42]